MTEISFENGAFSVDLASRTVRGILLPFNEQSRLGTQLKTEPVFFSRGSVELPRDPGVVTLNREHDQFSPLGRATMLEERTEGIYAEFAIAHTPEGDHFLASEYPNRVMSKLSAEVKGLTRDAVNRARAVAASLTGAAVCSEGAFASAALFAIDGTETQSTETVEIHGEPVPVEQTSSSEYTSTASDGSSYTDGTTTTTKAEDLGDGKKRITTTTVEVVDIEESEDEQNQENNTMAPSATIPGTLAASASNLVSEGEASGQAARDVFTLITAAHRGNPAAEKMLAALSDITPATGGGLITQDGVLQPNWLGQVWEERTYIRRYMPLINQGKIVAQDEKGFTVTAGTEPVQPWAGNKTALPSSGGETQLLGSVFQRWAWAADIAIEFFDIPGNEPIIAAFLRLVANSYARQTDKWTLLQLSLVSSVLAPASYPTLDPTRDYPTAIKQLIQGVDALSADPIDATPAFAIANPAAWSQIIYAPADALPAWMSLDFGITDQSGTADGKIRVVRGNIGIAGTPAVLVGAKDSAHVNELPGASPLEISALDIARGGRDEGRIGYTQFMADHAAALVLVGTGDARANTTAVARGAIVTAGGNTYRVKTAGTTAGSAPSAPSVGSDVADGSATLTRLS